MFDWTSGRSSNNLGDHLVTIVASFVGIIKVGSRRFPRVKMQKQFLFLKKRSPNFIIIFRKFSYETLGFLLSCKWLNVSHTGRASFLESTKSSLTLVSILTLSDFISSLSSLLTGGGLISPLGHANNSPSGDQVNLRTKPGRESSHQIRTGRE